jgi:hypothetical protein
VLGHARVDFREAGLVDEFDHEHGHQACMTGAAT